MDKTGIQELTGVGTEYLFNSAGEVIAIFQDGWLRDRIPASEVTLSLGEQDV